MNEKSKARWIIIDLIVFILLLITSISFFSKNAEINSQNEIEKELEKESENNMPIVDILETDDWVLSWEDNSWFIISWSYDSWIIFYEDCLIWNTWDYKILNVFSSAIKSPLNPQEYKNYTNQYNIIWKINDAKLCIVSDVVNYRKTHQYTYSTYILFWDNKYAWHINVWYSLKTKVVYDKTSWWTKDLDWRFWGNETPKIYNLDLNSVKVADTINWWTKKISPLKRLQQGWSIRIWWFVNAKNWEWRINKFVLAYKCKEWSECIIQ